jgi:hypothetical protein
MWSTMLDKLKNDFHVPIAILIFAVTSVMHFATKADLGPQYVNSLYALYAFLAGHAATGAWSKSKEDNNDSSGGSTGAK